jgi:hypothetical protein
MTQRALAACGGFLLAVLWFDLMFDVQVLGLDAAQPLPEPILASIATYYHRVTIEAFPMNRLVAAMMLAALATAVVQLVRRSAPAPYAVSTLLLCAAPIALALARIVPNAMRLAARTDTIAVQSELARSICRDHLLSALAIAIVVALQLLPGNTRPLARRTSP